MGESAGQQPSELTEAAENDESDKPKSVDKPKSAIEALADWIKPRKEILVAVAGIAAVVSSSVSFAVVHFATKSDLKTTECVLKITFDRDAMPVSSRVWRMTIEEDKKALDDLKKSQNPNITAIGRIETELGDIALEKTAADARYLAAIKASPVQCVTD
jgi:hypothetical protein